MATTPKTLAFEETTITKDNVKEFLTACSEELVFSPDNAFEDYITGGNQNKRATFKKKEAKNLNKRLDEAFEVCHREGIDIYEIPIKHLKK